MLFRCVKYTGGMEKRPKGELPKVEQKYYDYLLVAGGKCKGQTRARFLKRCVPSFQAALIEVLRGQTVILRITWVLVRNWI